jgi:DNA-binding LytR/AlgR family response regulator
MNTTDYHIKTVLNGENYETLVPLQTAKKKKRLIVRKGIENILLKLEDVVLFYTDSKIVYTLDKYGKKYICEENLSQLEYLLDDYQFFRANRQYIINSEYVKSYKTYEKVKLIVTMLLPELTHEIIISQETAPAFRQWISQQ